MTTYLAELFATEYARGVERLQSAGDMEAARLAKWLKNLDTEIDYLAG